MDLVYFVIKTIIITIAIMVIIAFTISKKKKNSRLKVLNQEWSLEQKKLSSLAKIKDKPTKNKPTKRLFVVHFNGDIKPSCLDDWVNTTNLLLLTAKPGDEVLVRLNSPGGSVHGYGHASYQIERLRQAKLKVICAIDQVAASGGYMIAAAADTIIASPFAIIGSIGVVMTTPNLHRLLDHHLIDVEQVTAGEYKRTLDPLTPNSEAAKHKTKKDIEVIHQHFKNHITQYRSHVNIDEVATGSVWLAKDALSLNLIDALQSADDYLLTKLKNTTIIDIKDPSNQSPWWKKLITQLSHRWSSESKLPEARMPS